MKYDIVERYDGNVLATADIDCEPSASVGVKNGLALKWAVANSVNVEHADFQHAVLKGANLRDANLQGVNLMYAGLQGAAFSSANLRKASLCKANLLGAVFTAADLFHANLQEANLVCATLFNTSFIGANLHKANLECANASTADFSHSCLGGANIRDMSIRMVTGNSNVLKSIQTGKYSVVFSPDVMAIGCQQHPIKDWWGFSDKDIDKMARGALEWWKKWKPILKAMIEEE